ncbi:hypothetical protein TNCV_3693181 [Trichonephila clavipes]|nr:hypothetical protein TNCV_3693181 [Trichonephila clavipes]
MRVSERNQWRALRGSKCDKNEDCKNGGICGQKRVCQCLEGTTGESCETVTDCKDLECENISAECVFDTEIKKATCACKDDTKLYVNDKCVKTCKKDEDCKNLGECVAHFCRCKPGTYGDDCITLDSCDSLKCEFAEAVCIYNESKNEPFCKCKDDRFIYENKKCICTYQFL